MAKKVTNITNFNEHLTGRYGARGSERRTEFEIKAKAFLIGELIKDNYLLYIGCLNLDWVKQWKFQLTNPILSLQNE